MNSIETIPSEFKGYSIKIHIHHDECCGAPWKEHDGHGIVSEWTSRDKRAGELVLCADRSSRRFYDFAGTMDIAKRDGWGLALEHVLKLENKLGRKPTAGEIRAAAVMRDFDYLRAWCNGEWVWLGYTTEIETPDGETIEGESCWGFDAQEHMVSEAETQARDTVESHIALVAETEIAACVP